MSDGFAALFEGLDTEKLLTIEFGSDADRDIDRSDMDAVTDHIESLLLVLDQWRAKLEEARPRYGSDAPARLAGWFNGQVDQYEKAERALLVAFLGWQFPSMADRPALKRIRVMRGGA